MKADVNPPTPQRRVSVSDDARPEIRNGLVALVAFFGVFVGFAAFVPMDAAIVAPGLVVVSGNRQTVQHRDGGIVGRINVREGQRVEAGELLVELAAAELVAQERSLATQLINLQLRRAYVRAEAEGRRLERPADWEALLPPEYRAQAEAELTRYVSGDIGVAGYNNELANISRQQALLNDELGGMRELADEQLVPLTRIRSLERGLAELGARRAELMAQRAAEMRQLDGRIAELTSQFAAVRQSLEQARIRAPATGHVVGLAFHTVGGVVRAGERVMDIVPENQPLVVEAQVDPRDADDLHPGLEAEVRITAFSGRNLPIVHGRVTRMSADRFTDQQTGRGYFVAQVEVSPEELRELEGAGGAERQLSAGLPAEVVAPTRKRTALQYLVEPLNQALWRAFRET